MMSRLEEDSHVAFGISETGSGLTITLAAKTRDELYRDAVEAALEAAYGGEPPAGASDGQTCPVQGAGLAEGDILRTFVMECLEAVRRAPGTLHAPRWLAFDEGRVTANLALSMPKTPARELDPALHGAVETEGAFPDFRATLAFSVPSH
jgi:hypothetical protein